MDSPTRPRISLATASTLGLWAVQLATLGLIAWLVIPHNPPGPDPDPGPKPLPDPTPANPLVIVEKLEAPVGRMTRLESKALGDVRWLIPPAVKRSADVQVYTDHVVICPFSECEIELGAVTLYERDGKPTLSTEKWVRITTAKPPPPVPPTPPTPPKPPEPPPSPAPIPGDGLRVLIVYESAELSKMPPAQQSVIFSTTVRDYLKSKCAVGPDGITKDWRIFDKDTDVSAEAKTWKDAMARPRASVPWIIISTGKTGHEGPLPATIDDTLTLLKKHGG